MDLKIRNIILWSWVVIIALAAGIAGFGKWYWSAGFLLAAGWVCVNFILTVALIKQALIRRSKQGIYLIILVKFPVLYVGGFYVLGMKVFPVASVLAGITAMFGMLFITGVQKLWTLQR